MATQMPIPSPELLAQEDVGNIILLEHVNVQVPEQSLATLFYVVGLGFTRDPEMMVGLENMWVNLGEQQFHLPTGAPQVLRGTVGLVVPDLEALAERLESVAEKLEGTQFAWSHEDGTILATSPWGNRYRCHEAEAAPGALRLGIPYVEFDVPEGTAAGIAAFYEQAIGCPASVSGGVAEVSIGQYQRLVFHESREVPPYDGHHIAVYVARFSGPCAWLAERGLVTEAPLNHQFRFQEIVDPEDGRPLFTIEHEVRSLKHALFRRPLANRTPGALPEPRRAGGRTVFGAVM